MVEKIIFDHELGDMPVRGGIISFLVVRNYQLWLAYRQLVPKIGEVDMEREIKTNAREKVMKDFKLKTNKMFYRAISMMENEV